MATYKTPGVYVNEPDAFPNSIVEVPTDIPAFVGYTQIARQGTADLTGKPTRVTSLQDFEALFGSAPATRFRFTLKGGQPSRAAAHPFFLYDSLRLFWANGGGPCWIVSVGPCATGQTPTVTSPDPFGEEIWTALGKQPEPSMVVIPDAVAMPDADAYKAIWDKAFPHCIAMKNRVAIIDVFEGSQPRSLDDADVISGTKGLRNQLAYDDMSFGAAYYPWLNTNLYQAADATFEKIHNEDLGALADYVKTEFAGGADPKTATWVDGLLTNMQNAGSDAGLAAQTHTALLSVSTHYKAAIETLLAAMNLKPPSGAMAGVFARTDTSMGVQKAPANVALNTVLSPTVSISSEEQEDLNVPLDGKAVNAIRAFAGRGTLVWGARTLAGNSEDYRYINLRRTAIMLEQSISAALGAFTFASNDSSTWAEVSGMISGFLTNQWKAGVLAGSRPSHAYSVSAGLGSTMTAQDVTGGILRVSVSVALSHPAEFTILEFETQIQSA